MPTARCFDFICLGELAERRFEIDERRFAFLTVNVENEDATLLACRYADVRIGIFAEPIVDYVNVHRSVRGPLLNERNFTAKRHNAPAALRVTERYIND